MAVKLHTLRLISVLLIAVNAEPTPGRIPKVYNALITSNQNLEPSKAYPVYQPVIHDPFAYPGVPVFYGSEFGVGNGILPPGALPSKGPEPSQPAPAPSDQPTPDSSSDAPGTEKPPTTTESSEPANPEPAPESPSTAAPPPPPNTQSPIPLNEFGLPSQVLPLGRLNPAYHGFTHLGPLTYSYPGVRLYDPYDPYGLGPYSFSLYRPLPNVLGPSISLLPARFPVAGAPVFRALPAPAEQNPQTPPPEPSDLNLLNYSSKDPAIPNVPPPPLPQSGAKSDQSE